LRDTKYADGGSIRNLENIYQKHNVIREQVRFAFAKVLGLDKAVDLLDNDKYGVSPYSLVERAVYSDLLLINEIDENLISSAISEAEDSIEMEEIGSSDTTYLIQNMLRGAGLKTEFVNNRLERVDSNGNVLHLKNELPKSTMFAKGGKISPKNDYIHIQDLLKILIESKNILSNEILSSDYDTPSKRVAKVQINRYFDLILSNLLENEKNAESSNGNKGYSFGDEPYSYINNFGVNQEDFIKLVDVYHSTNPLNQMDRIVERLTYKEFETKYGEETFNAVMDYIQKIHDFHNKYADGGNTSKLTEAEREQAEREIREAWEGKNVDDYVMYSDKYKKGGKVGDMYVAVGEKDGYWTIISKPSSKEKAQQLLDLPNSLPRGEVGKVVSVEDAKNHKLVVGREYLKYAKGGTTKRIKRRSC
jgi:hypothetical protein